MPTPLYLMKQILATDEHDQLVQLINDLILLVEEGNETALNYLGSLLRQTTEENTFKQELATKLFTSHSNMTNESYEEDYVNLAKAQEQAQSAQQEVYRLETIEKLLILDDKTTVYEPLDAYEQQTEDLQQNVFALKKRIEQHVARLLHTEEEV